MENEILENGTTPETEEIQEAVEVTETVEATETVETPVEAEAAAEEKKDIAAIFNNVVDKGKELIANPQTLLDKIKAVPAKIWAMIGGGVAALIAIIVVLSLLGNTYKTPIKAAEKLLSSKSVNQVLNRAPALLNGFGEDEAKVLIDIAKKSDYYKDYKEDIEEGFDSAIAFVEENIGKNYKISLKVTDKEKLKKDDLKVFRERLRTIGKMGSQLDDLDSDEIEDMADDLGITKAQAKKAIKTLKSFCKTCKSAKVQKGFELTVELKVTGKELDEPTELELKINMLKVDGRWIPDVFSLAENIVGSLDLGDLMGLAGAMGGMSGIGDLMGGF